MRDFKQQINQTIDLFRKTSTIVHTEKWQGVDITKHLEMATHEIRHHLFTADMPTDELGYYRTQIAPSLPWVDDHFAERVCGRPINPGKQWKHWPYAHSAGKFLDEQSKFNHNYMERYWPRWAGLIDQPTETPAEYDCRMDQYGPFHPHEGIYHPYGDLNSVVAQLVREPLTRQAILPVFFPEDTGARHGGRVPCSLLYQFLVRDGRMDITYMLRSCDLMRHFRDDIYLTVRLLLWVLGECRKRSVSWDGVGPGQFNMMITSLHVFRNDYRQMFEA